MAVIFMGLILFSIWNMRQDAMNFTSTYTYGSHSVAINGDIKRFDSVLVEKQRHIDLVEEITNGLYYVVFINDSNNVTHEVFAKKDLQRIIILSPHVHNINSK